MPPGWRPRLTRGGQVDLAAFATQFRPAILAAGEAPGPVRIYGEVVALLWAAGHVNAALELEGLWNELGRQIPFSLFCGYPRHLVESSQHQGAVAEVCRLHTAVVGRPLAVRQSSDQRRGSAAGGQQPVTPSAGPLGRRHAHVRGKP